MKKPGVHFTVLYCEQYKYALEQTLIECWKRRKESGRESRSQRFFISIFVIFVDDVEIINNNNNTTSMK